MDREKVCQLVLKLIQFIVATAFVTIMLVEFGRPPPFFDSYFDEEAGLPEVAHVFHAVNPVMHGETPQIHQLMDVPILFIALIFFFSVLYLRFGYEAWLVTSVAIINYFTYFTVNSWASNFFQWRYFYKRAVGIALQLAALAILATVSITSVMWKRKRLTFHMKSPFNIKIGGPTHVIWNLVGQSLLFYLCLLMWISRSYQSYTCTASSADIAFLCQVAEQVACIPCDQCTLAAFDVCAASHNSTSYQTAYCMSGIPYPRGFCIFNYNTGYFTFVRLVAYTGGLFFFARNFLNASMHYALLVAYSSWQWWKGNAAERLESTWSSLSSRFNVSESVNLRSYFKSRMRRHSAPGTVSPPPTESPRQVFRPHSPLLEVSHEDQQDEEVERGQGAQATERSSLLGSAHSTRSARSYGAHLTPTTARHSTYNLPSPVVEPAGVSPGSSREIEPLV